MRGLAQAIAALLCLLLVKSLAAQPADKERLMNELDLVDDDGSIETALMNYLFAKQVVNRLRSQVDVSDLQRKRSYWKQCAFNAVSCFGK
uniref:Allatostatin C n=1 Tax=Plautia stali TaxID=106108 RepID=A0A1E1G7R0_PLAST|nr:allatostatin C [Plautia stali]